jgi:hypothetical protein
MPERPPVDRTRAEPPEECANCGAAIPRSARACPECGADERSGWRDTDAYDGLDLPDEAFDDGPPARKHPAPPRVNGLAWYWWLVGVVVLVATGFLLLG